MTLATLVLLTPDAHACNEADDAFYDRDHSECGHRHDPPSAILRSSDDDDDNRDEDHRETEFQLRYGMQFLPDAPAHHGYARLVGKKDAYVGAEVRYMPASEMLWAGRVGAGFDILGGGNLDLTLGLWLGTAGEWDRSHHRAVLYNAPVAGTEIGLGAHAGRLFGRYRWLGGFGGGPIDALLTENELTVGFELVDGVQLFGQYLLLNPGERPSQSGLGIGVQASL